MIKYVQEITSSGPVTDEVYSWADEMGFKVDGGTVLINPWTFEPNRTWYFENEEVKLLFLLKWSNI